MATHAMGTMAALSVPPSPAAWIGANSSCTHGQANACPIEPKAAGTGPSCVLGSVTGVQPKFVLSKKRVGGRGLQWRGPVCEGPKDTRIHWSSDSEGWLGVTSSPETPVSADSNKLQQVRGDLLPLLLAAPSTYYKVLGVSPEAETEDIKAAYRRLSKQYHPDTTTLPLEVAAEQFMRLKEAHSILTSPEERRMYDWKLAQEVSRAQGGRFVWPYEVDRSQRGTGARPIKEEGKKAKDGENLELSSQAVSALAFDAFALLVAIMAIIYAVYFKN